MMKKPSQRGLLLLRSFLEMQQKAVQINHYRRLEVKVRMQMLVEV
jgi:hypothetical protein